MRQKYIQGSKGEREVSKRSAAGHPSDFGMGGGAGRNLPPSGSKFSKTENRRKEGNGSICLISFIIVFSDETI